MNRAGTCARQIRLSPLPAATASRATRARTRNLAPTIRSSPAAANAALQPLRAACDRASARTESAHGPHAGPTAPARDQTPAPHTASPLRRPNAAAPKAAARRLGMPEALQAAVAPAHCRSENALLQASALERPRAEKREE